MITKGSFYSFFFFNNQVIVFYNCLSFITSLNRHNLRRPRFAFRSILISLGLDYNTSLDLRDSSSERMESENGIDESKPYQEMEQITESPPPSNTVLFFFFYLSPPTVSAFFHSLLPSLFTQSFMLQSAFSLLLFQWGKNHRKNIVKRY